MKRPLLVVAGSALLAGPALADETVQYSYDAFGRVTQAAHSGSANNGLQQGYTFDPLDNRTNVTVTGSPFNSATRAIVLPILGGFVLPFTPGS